MVSFTPRPLCLIENDLATHRMGGWVGSRAGITFWRGEKFVAPVGIRTPARLRRELFVGRNNVLKLFDHTLICIPTFRRT